MAVDFLVQCPSSSLVKCHCNPCIIIIMIIMIMTVKCNACNCTSTYLLCTCRHPIRLKVREWLHSVSRRYLQTDSVHKILVNNVVFLLFCFRLSKEHSPLTPPFHTTWSRAFFSIFGSSFLCRFSLCIFAALTHKLHWCGICCGDVAVCVSCHVDVMCPDDWFDHRATFTVL